MCAGGQSSVLQRLSPRIDNSARVLPARGIDDRIDLLDRANQTTKQLTARII